MKLMGRKHRPFFRICAMDSQAPRGGRVIEELGTYDPMVSETDARALLKGERVAYWLGVGAQPSDKVKVLIKKYGLDGTHAEAQKVALEKLGTPRVNAVEPTPMTVSKKEEAAPVAEATEAAPEATTEETAAE